jgi:hypothetical protein
MGWHFNWASRYESDFNFDHDRSVISDGDVYLTYSTGQGGSSL